MRKLAVLGALALGVLAHVAHAGTLARRKEVPAELDVLYVPPPGQLAPMAVGYREALADLIWVRALIYSGSQLGSAQVDAVGRYVDAITGLSPRFRRAYLWGGITVVYGGQSSVTREMVDRAIGIYRAGMREFPESHELLYPFGMLLLTQSPSTPGYSDEERKAMREEGIELIRRAAAFGADPLVRQYAATLVSEQGDQALTIQFLESQLAQAEDEDHRRMLRSKLSRLVGRDATRRIEDLHRDFTAERDAKAPYVPDALWAVLRDETR
ncbi:MAG TPA: hypothetical protein VG755_25545 [Nannocystaceae bacterium]|nr:hypothetical protein [Nannocystaceae bacterium]